ncbi:MAG: TIGR01777 family protein [Austwickia sp.]|nr:TIGR01777 family protein [Austwickia sp.]MBK8435476.1 TIGR01777 family protein [Austwickia sp.]MBK9100976.1 TIGR01777 family protein [Austwickia sp.]
MSKNVAITGASGLIGSALSAHLVGRGDTVVHLVRRPARNSAEISWHPGGEPLEPSALSDLDAIVHLAGEPLSGRRWTSGMRAEIRRSRIESTRTLAKALTQLDRPIRWVSGSATGFYGTDRGGEELTETSSAGRGFLAEVCQAWEAQTQPAADAGHPVAHVRTGIVLAPHGGALQYLLPITKAGVAGPLGSGRQFWPWITLTDQVRALAWLIDHREVTGPVNLVAPTPATQGRISASIASAMGRPSVVPTPSPVLKLVLGEFADTILGSQRVLPQVLTDSGFTFQHGDIDAAADWLMSA